MSIGLGDSFPSGTFLLKDHEGVRHVSTEEYFKAKKVVLFALPGAFTPTCSAKHLPSYIKNHNQIIEKGVSVVACIRVSVCVCVQLCVVVFHGVSGCVWVCMCVSVCVRV